jgi:tRNA1Val (adenine37-N6)-methyltransferase
MTSTLAAEDLSTDAFLGGRLCVAQPAQGYRAGVDPVLLGAAVTAAAGESVLELGLGVGVASLCLAARVPGLRLTGVEVQADYADLARRNAHENGVDLRVVTCDLADLPADVRQESFDHVMMNPPYYDRATGTGARDPGRDLALAGNTPMAVWVDVAARRLRPRGWLTVIQRADRLPDVLSAIGDRLGSIMVRPFCPRTGRNAHLFIVRARKDGRAPFRLLSPIIMHDGALHEADMPDYHAVIEDVLRHGAALPWPS